MESGTMPLQHAPAYINLAEQGCQACLKWSAVAAAWTRRLREREEGWMPDAVRAKPRTLQASIAVLRRARTSWRHDAAFRLLLGMDARPLAAC
jgi:hypothetical protein